MAEAGRDPSGPADGGSDGRTSRRRRLAVAAALLGLGLMLALRVATLLRAGFNWDEFALFDGVARSLRDGVFISGGRPGLAQLLVTPLVDGCQDEILVGRVARGLWLAITLGTVAGLFCLVHEWLRGQPRRTADAALGTALLALLPVFLEWSIQVRTDQIALLGGLWGSVLLLRSERRSALALAAGLLFGVGWIGSQKLAYVGALGALLAAARPLATRTLAPRREALRAALALAAFAAVLLGFRALLASLFTLPETHAAKQLLGAQLESARETVFPFYRMTIGYSQYRALLPTLLPHALLGVALLVATGLAARRRRVDARALTAWAVLALGLAVGLFHAGAFAYFWMTLGLFPAVAGALALGPVRSRLLEARPELVRPLGIVLWVALALPALGAQLRLLRDTQHVQTASLAFVHRNFAPMYGGFQPEGALFCRPPQPMGIFFSQTLYRRFESPQRQQHVDALIAQFREMPVHYLVGSFRLNQFPLEVRRFWSEHYQPYRDAVFVAGAHLGPAADDAGALRQPFDLLVTGPYRWLPRAPGAPLEIDGRSVAPGGVVELVAGPHEARLAAGSTDGLLVLSMRDAPTAAPLAFYGS